MVQDYCDAGLSGASMERPCWREMLAAAVAGEFEVLLVLRLDRFGRGTAFAGEIERLMALGIEVVSVDGRSDYSTDEGLLMLGITSTLSGYERRRTFRRTNAGRRAKLKNGGFAGGDVPLGYRVEGNRRDAQVVPDEREREALRLAYTRIVGGGWSTPRVCAELDRLGYKPRKATRWAAPVLRRALRHEVLVTGVTWWGLPATLDTSARASGRDTQVTTEDKPKYGDPIRVEYGNPMFSPDEWEQLQAALDGRKTQFNPSGTYKRTPQLLTGRIQAQGCERTYSGVDLSKATQGRQKHVYRCGGRRNSLPKEQRCDHSQLDGPYLDELVWGRVTEMLGNERNLRAMGEDWLAANEVAPSELDGLQQQLTRLTTQRDRTLDLLLENPSLSAALRERASSLDAQVRSVQEQITQARATQQQRQARRDEVRELIDLVSAAREHL